jgi:hypothetical protein
MSGRKIICMSQATVRRRIAIVKDLVLFTLGLMLIYRQGWLVTKDEFNWWAMAFGIGLTQAPGAMALISLWRTAGGSSQQAPDAESLPSPSLLPASPEDDA